MIGTIANLWRLARVGATFARTGALARVVDTLDVPPYARAVMRAATFPIAPFGLAGDPSMPALPRAIAALGPAYIKFGQLMSTRPDICGAEIARELRVLQDRLAPFGVEAARATIEAELGRPLAEMFAEFEPPVAAASIAQVHPARLHDGTRVAVKVLRPGVERRFRVDIDSFYFIARTLEWLLPATRRLRPTAVVDHFNGVVSAEMDLRLEASSASEFRDNTQSDPGFVVPRIFWEFSGRRAITMEWVEGAPMGDPERLAAMGLSLPALAEKIIQVFLDHALRDGFFHADMHQGNLKVRADGAILALDFGIMGRMDKYTRRVYAEILYGFLNRDYRRIAEVHFEAGYVPPDQDIDRFAQSLRAIGEPIFGQDVSRISMAKLLAYLFEVTERFGMRTRTELILLQRTMVVVEGVARSLDPNANIWTAAKPVVETWMRENLGPRAVVRDLREAALTLARIGPKLPGLAEKLILSIDGQAEAEEKAAAEAARLTAARRGAALWAGGAGLALGAAAAWAALAAG
jgi:ubiquinone biosynthesis protein